MMMDDNRCFIRLFQNRFRGLAESNFVQRAAARSRHHDHVVIFGNLRHGRGKISGLRHALNVRRKTKISQRFLSFLKLPLVMGAILNEQKCGRNVQGLEKPRDHFFDQKIIVV